MEYQRTFNPKTPRPDDVGLPPKGLDIRDGSLYVCDEQTTLAVNIALATGRPLLLFGPPGSGKSSLAAFVARTMKWNYFEKVITSHTKAIDLLYRFDVLRRLQDSHIKNGLRKVEAYIHPGVFWWAFDTTGALRRSSHGSSKERFSPLCPGAIRNPDHTSVVLLDEIDKADPDMPNDLLVVLGSRQFSVEECSDITVKCKQPPLIVITSNNERSLPQAFVRRCVVYSLKAPDKDRLITIANEHFVEREIKDRHLFTELAGIMIKLAKDAVISGSRAPSTAEYLDVIRACLELNIRPDDSELWCDLQSAVLLKKE